jgi:acyl dehydratase
MAARWTSPVEPGETLRIESWREGKRISFRAFVKEREVKVLDHGHVDLF